MSDSDSDDVETFILPRKNESHPRTPRRRRYNNDDEQPNQEDDDPVIEPPVDSRHVKQAWEQLVPPHSNHPYHRFSQHAANVCSTELDRVEEINIQPYITSLYARGGQLFEHQQTKLEKTQSVVDRIVDELKLVKSQEERTMENRINGLKQKFQSNIETLEQHFIQRVDEFRITLNSEIQVEKLRCDKAIRSAAIRLQQSMENKVQKDISCDKNYHHRPPGSKKQPQQYYYPHEDFQRNDFDLSPKDLETDHHHSRRSYATKSNHKMAASSPSLRVSTNQDHLGSLHKSAITPVKLSPLSKTRLKLQRLEDKLAAYSEQSIQRAQRSLGRSQHRTQGFDDEIIVLPKSPTGKKSKWSRGIASRTTTPRENKSSYLLPREEEELETLKRSIGVTNDWISDNIM